MNEEAKEIMEVSNGFHDVFPYEYQCKEDGMNKPGVYCHYHGWQWSVEPSMPRLAGTQRRYQENLRRVIRAA